MNSTNNLLDFAKKLEQNEVVSPESGIKIRGFIRKTENPAEWQIFLTIGGILGALFASAGIFALISHNWDDFPKHLKGFFGLVPVLVALYFYYVAITKHKDSKTWIEASSLFLMLMIGASIALVSQTYQMDGDIYKFIKVWLVLTIPLFYIAKASFISFFYLSLTCYFLSDISIDFRANSILEVVTCDSLSWFWLSILAFLPHFYLALSKKSKTQGLRIVFMSYIIYFVIIAGLTFTIKSNAILWFSTVNVGFYLFGKQFMGDNKYILTRPLQWMSHVTLTAGLIVLSFDFLQYPAFSFDSIFNYDLWQGEQIFSFVLLLIVMGGVYFNFFRAKESFGKVNYLIVVVPFFLIFAMMVDEYTTSWWWLSLLINFYVLFLAIMSIINGSADGKIYKMAWGLLVLAVLLCIRYFDNDLGFITKGIVFTGVGGMFFLINLLVKDKVEDIERHQKLS